MCPASQQISSILAPHDGHIRFYVYHLDEVLEIQYKDDTGKWIPQAYEKINRLMRSRGDHLVTEMDKRLIELADHVQDHFKADTIEIISGYRSPKFNAQLKSEGHNVAKESYHMKGMAADIHVDEIKETTIRDYLKQLNLGGVGYYGDRLMVHMDFGPKREWHSGDFKENTKIGIFNKENDIKIRTDRLFYILNSKLQLSFTGLDSDKSGQLGLEKFHRGKWQPVKKLNRKSNYLMSELTEGINGMSPYGKFRLRLDTPQWQHSNEFYIKKK